MASIKKHITINCDLGEGVGLHAFGNDAALMQVIDVANVACGFHASDPHIMERTVQLAAEHEVAVGAHPGLPDLSGFGRRPMALSAAEVEDIVTYQVGALSAYLLRHGLELNHIKPHGALYGMVGRDPGLMEAVARVAKRYGVPVFGLANTQHKHVADATGVDFVSEVYVDLNYSPEGDLIIERAPSAAIPREAEARIKQGLEQGKIEATDGTLINVAFETVCVHSDPSNSVAVVKAVRQAINTASTAQN